ncbi:MAG: ATP-binding cassette domain-containing protein, partial [Firmicutes bacterium]|nr:ATP-binding cassette domain-containing protein [Bacillota bacterium]
IRDALDTAGLAIDTEAPNYALSGGMKQKLALAADLAMDPQLLIFDEPTANLDPEATSQVFAEIEQLIRSGRTLLIIEHKFEALLDVVPYLVLIDRLGQIRSTGPTKDVVRAAQDPLRTLSAMSGTGSWRKD